MEAVPVFDWLRWVEIPLWLGVIGWLATHIRHDHEVEVDIKEKLAKIDGIETMIVPIFNKLIRGNDE